MNAERSGGTRKLQRDAAPSTRAYRGLRLARVEPATFDPLRLSCAGGSWNVPFALFFRRFLARRHDVCSGPVVTICDRPRRAARARLLSRDPPGPTSRPRSRKRGARHRSESQFEASLATGHHAHCASARSRLSPSPEEVDLGAPPRRAAQAVPARPSATISTEEVLAAASCVSGLEPEDPLRLPRRALALAESRPAHDGRGHEVLVRWRRLSLRGGSAEDGLR